MKNRFLVFSLLFLAVALFVNAQVAQTGSLRGTVTDAEGIPLPGVSVTVSGPALIGTDSSVTSESGNFRFPSLPPGAYKLELALQGFNTVVRDNIIVRVGQAVTVDFTMAQAQLAEEVTVIAPSPTVDTVNTKIVQNITSEALQQIPLARSVYSAIQLAPGTVERTIHGSARNDSAYSVDGVVANAPDQNYGEVDISWDMIEEIELITGGATSEAFNAIGGFINIVTKSGGNAFSGSAQAYYTNEDMSHVILPEESLKAIGLSKPAFPKYDWEGSAQLGGPILKDRLWFLGNFRYGNQSRYGVFRPTTILGKSYDNYDWDNTNTWAFGKLTAQLMTNVRGFLMLSYHTQHRPTITQSWSLAKEANTDHLTKAFTGTGSVNWTLDSDTFVDARFGFWHFDYDGVGADPATWDQPALTDVYTSYRWNGKGMFDFTRKRVLQGSVKMTRFQDDFLGGDHEIKAGIELSDDSGGWGYYRINPLSWDYYNGNPYYWRGLLGLSGPDPVRGDGRLSFAAIGPDERADQASVGEKFRVGVFLQDSFKIGRLTVNLGVRYDKIKAGMPASTKYAANSPIALALGAQLFQPTYGLNPFDEIQYAAWKDAFPYSVFAPTVGIVYDIFGTGRTALKASFGKYAEGLPGWYFTNAHPISPASFNFDWFDLNLNGQPDLPGVDQYVSTGGTNVVSMTDTTAIQHLIDPNIKIPHVNEYHVAVEHELLSDFRVTLAYHNKDRRNIMGNPYYGITSGEYWSDVDSGYWIAFPTTIPATGDFPATDVTMYFPSKTHPDIFQRVTNLDEAKVKYEAIELGFSKRMTKGWMVGGSLVLSKNEGNYTITGGTGRGLLINPNQWINAYGDEPYSRPVVFKLYGSVTLPLRVIVSAFYLHASGTPWNRTVSVVPPTAWVTANNTENWSYTINVEPPGTRRNQSTDNLDLRAEKEFSLGRYGKVGIFADVFNLFGFSIISMTNNPGGTWRPTAPSTTAGTYTVGWTGITGYTGTRTVRLSVRYSF